MARADLLVKLIKAGISGDTSLFTRVSESIIAEERGKQHHVLANQLEGILLSKDNRISRNNSSPASPLSPKFENFLFRIHPNRRLEDLVLADENRQKINEIIQEQFRADILRSYNLEPRNRVLLCGAPGNGKTSLAEALAQSLMIPFYVIRYDGIIGSYLGETATRLKQMFDFVKTQECVLFFDEFDAIGKERGDQHETGEIKRVVSSLLMQIDRLPSYVVVVAATNHPELLDRAVWRRFQIKLDLNKPTKSMIESWLSNFENQVKYSLQHPLSSIAARLVGLSFSEVEEFVLDIQRKYILALPEVNIKKIVDECLTNHTHHNNQHGG